MSEWYAVDSVVVVPLSGTEPFSRSLSVVILGMTSTGGSDDPRDSLGTASVYLLAEIFTIYSGFNGWGRQVSRLRGKTTLERIEEAKNKVIIVKG